jgi:predicted glycosyltransferase
VAFGLGVPIISTVDTPYADAVHRLTLPLSKHIIASEAIPSEVLQKYAADREITSFKGVDEVAWIKDPCRKEKYDFDSPLIVVRQLEEKAAYTKNKVNMLAIAKKLTRLGTVVFLSRYTREKIKGLVVPKGFVDSVSLVDQADLFVGVGGTITREAALQGTPAIVVKVFSEQYVNDYLIKKGFPIFEEQPSKMLRLANKILGKKFDVQKRLNKLENPVDVISEIVKEMPLK